MKVVALPVNQPRWKGNSRGRVIGNSDGINSFYLFEINYFFIVMISKNERLKRKPLQKLIPIFLFSKVVLAFSAIFRPLNVIVALNAHELLNLSQTQLFREVNIH